jgi:4-aminobutyrate aminotransferase-like enzyme
MYKFKFKPQKVKKINSINRRINTKIPAPGTNKVILNIQKYQNKSMNTQLPIVWKKAENFSIYDLKDNKFIDFSSTIFVTNIGHSNKEFSKKMSQTINQKLIHSYIYANKKREEYLKKLIKFCGKNFQKAFLLSSGSEATEAALKLMRMHGKKINKRRYGILSFTGNWHGRTVGSQMMSGNFKQQEWIGYKDKDIHYLTFPYEWELHKKDPIKNLYEDIKNLNKKGIDLKKDICGIIIETFQGWCSSFYPKNYMKKLVSICKKNNILVTFDEIQAGFGRTGKKFGYQHYNVKPDLICCGKAMGNGYPISGVLGKKKILDIPNPGEMSSTHSSNPLACAAGISVLDEINKKKLVTQSFKKGKILKRKLNKIKQKNPDLILSVQSKGLIGAIIFKNHNNKIGSYIASKICEKAMQKGLLLVHTSRESIKIGPPLTISEKALIEGIDIIEECINEVI